MPKGRTAKLFAISVTLLMTTAVLLMAIGLLRAWWSTPFPVLGFTNAPEQPLDFPHDIHVEQMGIQCEFCHRNVSEGEAATVPAVEQCLFCHKILPGGTFAGKDGDRQTAVEQLHQAWTDSSAINWKRVYRLPDHVQFKHEPHIRFFSQDDRSTEQVCALCHGNVGQMAKVEVVKDLKMSDCVDCHRQNNAPTDCVICHY